MYNLDGIDTQLYGDSKIIKLLYNLQSYDTFEPTGVKPPVYNDFKHNFFAICCHVCIAKQPIKVCIYVNKLKIFIFIILDVNDMTNLLLMLADWLEHKFVIFTIVQSVSIWCVMESGVPIGGIVPGAVRAWLLGRAVVNLPTQYSVHVVYKTVLDYVW